MYVIGSSLKRLGEQITSKLCSRTIVKSRSRKRHVNSPFPFQLVLLSILCYLLEQNSGTRIYVLFLLQTAVNKSIYLQQMLDCINPRGKPSKGLYCHCISSVGSKGEFLFVELHGASP